MRMEVTPLLARWYAIYLAAYAEEGIPPTWNIVQKHNLDELNENQYLSIVGRLVELNYISEDDGRPLKNLPLKVNGTWIYCPFCGYIGSMVNVFGHEQCQSCHMIVERCCDD